MDFASLQMDATVQDGYRSYSLPSTNIVDNYSTFDNYQTKRLTSCQTITPSYYPDMTHTMIGKRPVYSARTCEFQIPNTIMTNVTQLNNRNFDCHQPLWNEKCT